MPATDQEIKNPGHLLETNYRVMPRRLTGNFETAIKIIKTIAENFKKNVPKVPPDRRPACQRRVPAPIQMSVPCAMRHSGRTDPRRGVRREGGVMAQGIRIGWMSAWFLSLLAPLAVSAALVSVGPDAFFQPRALTQLNTASPVLATPLAGLGDGSVGFNGGLAYNTVNGMLYTIGNDSFGGSALYRMSAAGSGLAAVGAGLGQGFFGGLAYHASSGGLFAIASDSAGLSALYAVDLTGTASAVGSPLGFGFHGGMSFDAADGLLYAIAADAFGVPRELMAIDPVTGVASRVLGLGDGSLGFNGGLAYDSTADSFYAVGNDPFGNSSLFSFSLTGGTTPGGDLAAIGGSFGQGFVNAGLALAPAGERQLPEPPALALVLLAAWLGLQARRRG
jgi:hypothetical protein